MSEWITDRRPCGTDGIYVYDAEGRIEHRSRIGDGQPWKPIPKCEPYVKPKRYTVELIYGEVYAIFKRDVLGQKQIATDIPTIEAAERIAAIYEEVMP